MTSTTSGTSSVALASSSHTCFCSILMKMLSIKGETSSGCSELRKKQFTNTKWIYLKLCYFKQFTNTQAIFVKFCVYRQFTNTKHTYMYIVWINSSLCTVPFMPFLKCPSAMPFLKCPSAMPFLNCPSRIRFLKMPFLNYFPPKGALPQNSFPKKCPSLTCPPTIPHQRQCKHCNN